VCVEFSEWVFGKNLCQANFDTIDGFYTDFACRLPFEGVFLNLVAVVEISYFEGKHIHPPPDRTIQNGRRHNLGEIMKMTIKLIFFGAVVFLSAGNSWGQNSIRIGN